MAAPGPQPICSYASVTLAPGQQFTLPPGSVIISATNPTGFTSTCAIPPLETPQCYGFTFLDSNETDDNTGFDKVTLDGLNINGVRYPFSSIIVVDSDINNSYFCNGCVPTRLVTDFRNRVQTLSIGSVFSNFNGYSDNWGSSQDYAAVYTLCWKTIPSLAINAYVYGTGNTDGGPTLQVSWPITRPPWSLGGCGCS